eukprot:scaffold12.g8192.t1
MAAALQDGALQDEGLTPSPGSLFATLRQENAELRERLAALQAENDALKAKLEAAPDPAAEPEADKTRAVPRSGARRAAKAATAAKPKAAESDSDYEPDGEDEGQDSQGEAEESEEESEEEEEDFSLAVDPAAFEVTFGDVGQQYDAQQRGSGGRSVRMLQLSADDVVAVFGKGRAEKKYCLGSVGGVHGMDVSYNQVKATCAVRWGVDAVLGRY